MTMVNRRLTNNDDKSNSNEVMNNEENIIASTAILQLKKNQNISTATSTATTLELDNIGDVEVDDEENDLENDVQHLLSHPSTKKTRSNDLKCCRSTYKVGNCTVLFP